MKVISKDVKDLKNSPYNPRNISEDASKGLRKSLDRFGMVQLIIWNQKTGNVIGGNQRLKLLRAKKVKKTKVVVVDMSLSEEKALNLSLNNKAIQGDWDIDKLQAMIGDLKDNMAANELIDLRISDLQKEVKKGLRARKDLQDDPKIKFTEELLECHNYLVLYFDNDVDWLQVRTLLGLKTVKALDSKPGYKKQGIGRVLNGAKAIQKIQKGVS